MSESYSHLHFIGKETEATYTQSWNMSETCIFNPLCLAVLSKCPFLIVLGTVTVVEPDLGIEQRQRQVPPPTSEQAIGSCPQQPGIPGTPSGRLLSPQALQDNKWPAIHPRWTWGPSPMDDKPNHLSALTSQRSQTQPTRTESASSGAAPGACQEPHLTAQGVLVPPQRQRGKARVQCGPQLGKHHGSAPGMWALSESAWG